MSDLSFLGVPRDHVPSWRSREVSAPCWGWLSGSQRFHPNGYREGFQNAALTDRSIRRSEVQNICQLEMKMVHSEEIKTHRTLHIEFRVTAAVVQFLKYSRGERLTGVMNPRIHFPLYKAKDRGVSLKISNGRKSSCPLAVQSSIDRPPKAIPHLHLGPESDNQMFT